MVARAAHSCAAHLTEQPCVLMAFCVWHRIANRTPDCGVNALLKYAQSPARVSAAKRKCGVRVCVRPAQMQGEISSMPLSLVVLESIIPKCVRFLIGCDSLE